MKSGCYGKLARHLDSLPGGFPASETGVELRLLKRLFTPEEAELAVYLTLEQEEASAIADRAGIEPTEVAERLSRMARKGLIFSIENEGQLTLYQATPWIVGIYEFQVNRLDEDFAKDFNEHTAIRIKDPRLKKVIPQVRTIPVGRSIQHDLEILPYEKVEDLVKAQQSFAVAPCICRRKADILGNGCEAPRESCLMFGKWADYYVRNGQGRAIDQGEVMDILLRADEANLVLQPSNSIDIAFVCACCGCCCGVLANLKRHPRPSERVANAFIAKAEPEICEACGVCMERCQMDALELVDDQVVLDSDRCIGCGLCVSTCPTGALTLTRKPLRPQVRIPETLEMTWKEIGRSWGKQE